MSGDHTPTGNAGARILATPNASTCNAQLQWRQERLFEARGILADIAHHPGTLVLLACQVICAHSPDPTERADALGVMRLLGGQLQKMVSTAPKGGAA